MFIIGIWSVYVPARELSTFIVRRVMKYKILAVEVGLNFDC